MKSRKNCTDFVALSNKGWEVEAGLSPNVVRDELSQQGLSLQRDRGALPGDFNHRWVSGLVGGWDSHPAERGNGVLLI